MEKSNPLYTKIVVALVVLTVYFSMKAMGLTVGDLWGMVEDKVAATREETRDYRATTYSDRVSREMRDQAAKMPGADPAVAGTVDGDLNNELATERKRILEQQAEVAAQNRNKMLKGDAESLKRQVRNNVREAGGDN